MIIEPQLLRSIIESALLAYGQPLTIEKLQTLFVDDKKNEEADEPKAAANDSGAGDSGSSDSDDSKKTDLADVPTKEEIIEALEAIQQSCEGRGFELKKVSSGWRFQVRADMAPWVNRLWEEKPQRYSRALLETLSIIAYRQPITRGDIEEIRGVAVSSHIIKTLTEREWIKVVGHRDVPGRPSLFATTRQFLDYFNLESLEELPSLRELADIESLSPELDLQTAPSEEGQKDEASEVNEASEASEEHVDTTLEEQGELSEVAEQFEEVDHDQEQNVEADEMTETTLEENLRSE